MSLYQDDLGQSTYRPDLSVTLDTLVSPKTTTTLVGNQCNAVIPPRSLVRKVQRSKETSVELTTEKKEIYELLVEVARAFVLL